MDARQVLRDAADHIEKYGLLRGTWVPDWAINNYWGRLFDANCPACAGGALAIAVTRGLDFSPNFVKNPDQERTLDEAFDLVISTLELTSPYGYAEPRDVIVEWSDSSTQEEVVAGLRQAAG